MPPPIIRLFFFFHLSDALCKYKNCDQADYQRTEIRCDLSGCSAEIVRQIIRKRCDIILQCAICSAQYINLPHLLKKGHSVDPVSGCCPKHDWKKCSSQKQQPVLCLPFFQFSGQKQEKPADHRDQPGVIALCQKSKCKQKSTGIAVSAIFPDLHHTDHRQRKQQHIEAVRIA